MLDDLRKKAIERKNIIYTNKNSTFEDKEKINDIIQLLSKEDNLNKVSRSTVLAIFNFLGYDYQNNIKNYFDMYDKLMNEVNKTYTLIETEEMTR